MFSDVMHTINVFCVIRVNKLIDAFFFSIHIRFGQDCNGDARIDCYDHALIHYLGGYGCKGNLPDKIDGTFKSCLNSFLQAN